MIDTAHLRHLPEYTLATKILQGKQPLTDDGALVSNDTSPATCFFCAYNDMYVLYATTGKIASSIWHLHIIRAKRVSNCYMQEKKN